MRFAALTAGIVTLLAAAGGVCQAETARIAAGPLRVGIATADITPQGPVNMAGFGFRKKPSEGVGKPISASCVVFDNGVTRLALVAIDLCHIGKTQLDDLRAAAQKAKIPPQHLMVNFSHTHSGPNVQDDKNAAYAAAVQDSAPTRCLPRPWPTCSRPCWTIPWAPRSMAVNRRRLDEKRHYGGDDARTPQADRPRRAHPPRHVGRGQGPGRAVRLCAAIRRPCTTYRISPDYVGYARDWIAAVYPGCVPVFFQGCGGDIKARYVDGNGKFDFPENLLSPDAFTAELGHELGRAVVAALCRAARAGAGRPAQGAAGGVQTAAGSRQDAHG